LSESSWHLKGIPRLDAAAVSAVMTTMDQAGETELFSLSFTLSLSHSFSLSLSLSHTHTRTHARTHAHISHFFSFTDCLSHASFSLILFSSLSLPRHFLQSEFAYIYHQSHFLIMIFLSYSSLFTAEGGGRMDDLYQVCTLYIIISST
jgi:hypothetical protein